MSTLRTPPSRIQLAKIAGNDPELVKALEQLFQQALSLTPTELDAVTSVISTNRDDIATSADDIAANAAGIVTVNTRIDNLAVDDLADVSATAPTLGMILIYNAAADAWQANTITAGSNITIANANGAITVSVTGLGAMAFQNTGATGSFTAASGETITAVDGVITSIV